MQESRLKEPKIIEVIDWSETRASLPAGVKKKGCYLFEHSADGVVEEPELKDLLRQYKDKRYDGSKWPVAVELPAARPAGARSRGGSMGSAEHLAAKEPEPRAAAAEVKLPIKRGRDGRQAGRRPAGGRRWRFEVQGRRRGLR